MPTTIAIVQGSIRPGNYTAKAAALVADEIASMPDVEADVIDPSQLTLIPPGLGDVSDAEVRARVGAAHGVVLATPEYHGSYSSVMKLVIENLGFPSALSKKPIALLGVAAGDIGAIKALEHLRSVASHVGGIVLPGPVSIANVRSVFAKDGTITDAGAEKRIRSVAKKVLEYLSVNACPVPCLEEMVRG